MGLSAHYLLSDLDELLITAPSSGQLAIARAFGTSCADISDAEQMTPLHSRIDVNIWPINYARAA